MSCCLFLFLEECMKKKILIYISIIIMVASLLSLAFLLKPKNNNINDNQLEEIKTIEQQVVEVLSIEETDKNVIGYISIETVPNQSNGVPSACNIIPSHSFLFLL